MGKKRRMPGTFKVRFCWEHLYYRTCLPFIPYKELMVYQLPGWTDEFVCGETSWSWEDEEFVVFEGTVPWNNEVAKELIEAGWKGG